MDTMKPKDIEKILSKTKYPLKIRQIQRWVKVFKRNPDAVFISSKNGSGRYKKIQISQEKKFIKKSLENRRLTATDMARDNTLNSDNLSR